MSCGSNNFVDERIIEVTDYTDADAEAHAQEVGVPPRPNETISEIDETGVYGHGFADQPGHKDPLTGAYFLSEFYKRAKPDFQGRATTPTLVDIIEKKAVNNDYHRLSNYLEVQFRSFQPVDAPDLYPVKYRKEIDELNDWLFPHINNGHYRMAFCQFIGAYNEAFDDFYDSMDKLEERLETNRFLFGDYITDSDIRFYVTLVRWDTSYYRNVGPIKHRIVDYKNIWGYVRDLYSLYSFVIRKERPMRSMQVKFPQRYGTVRTRRIAIRKTEYSL